MRISMRRALFWSVPLVLAALALVYAFQPSVIETDLATVRRGPLAQTVTEEGKTRIRDVFVLSAPIRGRTLRIEIEAGDSVVADETVVAEIEPTDPDFLDVRSAAEIEAEIGRAAASLDFAKAELRRISENLKFATSERARIDKLRASGTVSARTQETAERDYHANRAALSAARATIKIREAELAAARARAIVPSSVVGGGEDCDCLPIFAPVSGRVLQVVRESEGVVEAGQTLVEIGDPANLEIVVDFLSTDAVRIAPGQRVVVDGWGGTRTLNGVVKRVEPFGFTKVSALGIEEQRVNVVIGLIDDPKLWRRLGHGFRVDANVVLWEDSAALQAPLTALFREGGQWAVFKIVDGKAALQPVEVGHRTELAAEIVDGLAEGDVVVAYPSDRIVPGAKIGPRGG